MGITFGLVRVDLLGDDGGWAVEEVMRPGPTTVRAGEDVAELVGRMRRRKVPALIVTDPEGRPLGLFLRKDGERSLKEIGAHP